MYRLIDTLPPFELLICKVVSFPLEVRDENLTSGHRVARVYSDNAYTTYTTETDKAC
jgi:hypothetical protein